MIVYSFVNQDGKLVGNIVLESAIPMASVWDLSFITKKENDVYQMVGPSANQFGEIEMKNPETKEATTQLATIVQITVKSLTSNIITPGFIQGVTNKRFN